MNLLFVQISNISFQAELSKKMYNYYLIHLIFLPSHCLLLFANSTEDFIKINNLSSSIITPYIFRLLSVLL